MADTLNRCQAIPPVVAMAMTAAANKILITGNGKVKVIQGLN
jgi:hypothetical protein